MIIDWQTIAVALIILAAFAYVARRGLARLQSMNKKRNDASCETGCGKCGTASTNEPKAKPFVQIGKMTMSKK